MKQNKLCKNQYELSWTEEIKIYYSVKTPIGIVSYVSK